MPDEDATLKEAVPEPDAAGRGDEGARGDEEAAAVDPELGVDPEAEGGAEEDRGRSEPDEGVDEAAEHVEVILDDVLSTAESERDEFRDHLLRLQADFDNYRKRVQKELGEAGDKALGRFVEELLPVLYAVDAARFHGASDLDQVSSLLVDLLAKQGLERVGAEGDVFDPTLHDAVLHEAGEDDVQSVAQVLRAGWRWRGRVLRPAMVKVVGG